MTEPKMLRLKPSPGLVVRDPETGRPLSQEGEEKPRNSHWVKRLRDGDVIDMNAPTPVQNDEPAAEESPTPAKPAGKRKEAE